mmetsp:Transcript_2860/g.4881  ORF Transcript_2860/g.4881 Transcript_2860/m.4881 type:complete len:346 (-) Transcript_2860:355-1392(-)
MKVHLVLTHDTVLARPVPIVDMMGVVVLDRWVRPQLHAEALPHERDDPAPLCHRVGLEGLLRHDQRAAAGEQGQLGGEVGALAAAGGARPPEGVREDRARGGGGVAQGEGVEALGGARGASGRVRRPAARAAPRVAQLRRAPEVVGRPQEVGQVPHREEVEGAGPGQEGVDEAHPVRQDAAIYCEGPLLPGVCRRCLGKWLPIIEALKELEQILRIQAARRLAWAVLFTMQPAILGGRSNLVMRRQRFVQRRGTALTNTNDHNIRVAEVSFCFYLLLIHVLCPVTLPGGGSCQVSIRFDTYFFIFLHKAATNGLIAPVITETKRFLNVVCNQRRCDRCYFVLLGK